MVAADVGAADPGSTGTGGPGWPIRTALVVLLGLGRLQRALWLNRRYRFRTWRWGKVTVTEVQYMPISALQSLS